MKKIKKTLERLAKRPILFQRKEENIIWFLAIGSTVNRTFKVGIYIRLSREDGDKLESESVSNQRDILQRYIKENELIFIEEYIDDGISRNNI